MVNGILEFDSVELSYSGRDILRSVHIKCTTGEIIGLLLSPMQRVASQLTSTGNKLAGIVKTLEERSA